MQVCLENSKEREIKVSVISNNTYEKRKEVGQGHR